LRLLPCLRDAVRQGFARRIIKKKRMALNKAILKTQLKALQQEMKGREDDSMDYYAEQLATIIDAYIKTATVSTTVTGSCATPAGPGTIAGTGTGVLT